MTPSHVTVVNIYLYPSKPLNSTEIEYHKHLFITEVILVIEVSIS